MKRQIPCQKHLEGDKDYTQRELRAETRLTGPRDSEDATRRSELIAGPLKVAQESEEDYSQTVLASTEDNNEDASATQRQDQRAESSTVVQENCPQEKCDVHSSHGLTEEQSIISILSFALRHNTTGVLMEDLLKLLKLHSAGTTAVPRSKYFLEKPFADITKQFEQHHYCKVCTKYTGSSQTPEEMLTCVPCSLSTTVQASLEEGHFLLVYH
ncbi:uncharacterized protein LOC118566101 [Fundulus heteroclitus]|uniref:uncharacterized protein LOC118566101 n=1 Tax=Fundulus heteroclitus TaxID=8078 RepID=UPI00165A8FDA|nr:uncharacterized protein LOC118566101 [Fundulus heteroclitus]